MKKIPLLIATLLLLGVSAYAQKTLNLFVSAGRGTIDNYDLGTVPYHIKGSTKVRDWGFNYLWDRHQIQVDGRYLNSTLKTFEGTNQAVDLNLEYLYRCINSDDNRFRFHTGAALKTYGEIKTLPDLQNASVGISIVGDLRSVNLVEYDFAFNQDKTHNWLTAYGKLSLPLIGFANRPGFTYVYDAQGMDIIQRIFAGHQTFSKFFPGCSTDFGLWLNLKNNNRIGLDYRWDYLSTGKKDIWRYDNAYHTINLSFVFNLKSTQP